MIAIFPGVIVARGCLCTQLAAGYCGLIEFVSYIRTEMHAVEFNNIKDSS